jgi:N-acetylglutamate synthase-like GNAT family acetyltransferase
VIANIEPTKDGQLETGKEFFVSTDKTKLNIEVIHGFLSKAYWSVGVPRETIKKTIKHSLCFGVYQSTPNGDKQVGYARVVTDYSVIAYLGDVFILDEYRGKGLSKMLMEEIMAHPDLQGLRRWSLATRDAHGLYEKFGFMSLKSPERMMEIHRPNVYS